MSWKTVQGTQTKTANSAALDPPVPLCQFQPSVPFRDQNKQKARMSHFSVC